MAAVVSLGLGIGANTTVFTLLDSVLLRPLPVKEPSRLAAVFTVDSHNPGSLLCSYPNYKDYRDRNRVFSSLLLYSTLALNVNRGGEPETAIGQIVSGNYFATLGVQPVLGRGFLESEDSAPGASPVVVISSGFWESQFGRDPHVIGRNLLLNGRAFEVIGVAPGGFRGLDTLVAADLWVPMVMYEQVYPNPQWVNQRRALIFSVVGRLRSGVPVRQAEAALQLIARDLEREYPRDNEGRRVRLTSLGEAAIGPANRPGFLKAGAALMIVAALVLLIACANVANLLLARASSRNKEIVVRLALGASRWRLVRRLLVESVLLALLGGAAGVAFAKWAQDALWALRPPLFAFSAVRLDLDARAFGYTIALALATGILFGLTPALRATQADLASDLRERAGQSGSKRLRSVLVSGQLAFSLVALVGAGLFTRSLHDAESIDPGFAPGGLGTVAFNIADQGYGEEGGRQFQNRTLEAALETPGVASAALADDGPLGVSLARTVLPEGHEGAEGRFTLTRLVSPGYFKTMGMVLSKGRDFDPRETPDTPRTAVVNEAAAAYYWPGQNALGKRLRFFGDDKTAEVVGVVRNANYQAIGEVPQAMIYLSLSQYYFPAAVLYVRASGSAQGAGSTLAAVRHKVQSLNGRLSLQSEVVDRTILESLWAPRLTASLLGVFGAFAMLLAAVGVYGVVAYSVNQRKREIGIRMALGATPKEVRAGILGEGARMAARGLVVGMALALVAARGVRSLLIATSAWDAVTFVLVPALLVLVAIAASWIPALRATRVDPAQALRTE